MELKDNRNDMETKEEARDNVTRDGTKFMDKEMEHVTGGNYGFFKDIDKVKN